MKLASNSNDSPIGKKLIQARLPFKTVTPKTTTSSSSSSSSTLLLSSTPSSSTRASSPTPELLAQSSNTSTTPIHTKSVSSDEPRGKCASLRKRKLSATPPSVTRKAKINRTDDDKKLPWQEIGPLKSAESKENIINADSTPTVTLSSDDENDQILAKPLPKTPNDKQTDRGSDVVNVPKAPQSNKRVPSQSGNGKVNISDSTKRKTIDVPEIVIVPDGEATDDNNDKDECLTNEPNVDRATGFSIKLPTKKQIDHSKKSTANAPAKSSDPSTRTSPRKNRTPAKLPIDSPVEPPVDKPKKTPTRKSQADSVASSEIAIVIDESESISSSPETTTESFATPSKIQPKYKRTRLSSGVATTASSPAAATAAAASPVTAVAGLTPKQQQRKQEADARLREKQRQRDERERKLADEKEQRQRERDEKERQRKRERDEKEEQRRVEREQKRQEELEEKRRREEQRDEERKRKEEQREEERKRREEQKEEDRRRKEEEKTAKQLADQKKNEKSVTAITKFFTARNKESFTSAAAPSAGGAGAGGGIAATTAGADGMPAGTLACDASNDADAAAGERRQQNFMPFCVKEDMKLAPLVRRVFSAGNRELFDECVLRDNVMADASDGRLYLRQLRTGEVPHGRAGKTWSNLEQDVQVVEDELEGAAAVIEEPIAKRTYRAKFFKFEENRRPPFYGTWRRRSGAIRARKPFAIDTVHFDYECDSDDEWEEEEPGESLHGSDDDKEDKESDDDEYDIDNKFFVPHGHLSDEEMGANEDGDDDDDDDCDDDKMKNTDEEMHDNSPAAQKAKLKIIQMQFAHEMKKKTEKIKPRLVGCVWQRPDGGQPTTCAPIIWEMLCAHRMQFDGPSIRLVRPPAPAMSASASMSEGTSADRRPTVATLSDNDVADLVRLLHGNVINRAFLQKEFQAFLGHKYADNAVAYRAVSLSSISAKIQELSRYQACPDEGDWLGKFCWYVPLEVRNRYGVNDVSIPNEWSYTLKRPNKQRLDAATSTIGVDDQPQNVAATPLVSVNGTNEKSVGAKSANKSSKFNISQFAKVLNDEKGQQSEDVDREHKSEIGTSTTTAPPPGQAKKRVALTTVNPSGSKPTSTTATPTAIEPVVRKRVSLLASVPLNQEFSTATRKTLISNFLNKRPSAPPQTAADANQTATVQVAGEKEPIAMIEID